MMMMIDIRLLSWTRGYYKHERDRQSMATVQNKESSQAEIH